MSLYFFLVVLISLGCGTLPSLQTSWQQPAAATAMMVTAWCLLCHISVRLIARQANADHMPPLTAVTWMEKQLAAFRWLGLGVIVLCLGGFGLGRTLDTIPYVGSSMFLQAIILLAPGLAIITANWSAEHYYGMLVGFAPRNWRKHFSVTLAAVRSGAGWLIVPVLLLMGLSDLIAVFAADEAQAGWIMLGSVLLGVPLALPLLMRVILKTEPVSAADARLMQLLLKEVGLGGIKLVRWNTGGTTFNAMVAGFVPRMRTMMLSDRLLDGLSSQQIAMVVLHEAAHLKRRHVPMRMLSVLPAWGAGVLVTRIAGDLQYAAALGTTAGVLLTILILRIASYRTEFDADRQACLMAAKIGGRIAGVPAGYEEAASALSTALVRVTMDHPQAQRSTWLHPGLDARLDNMRRPTSPIHSNATAGTIANPA